MMDARCIVNAGEFQKALEKVLKVAPKKCSIPALMEVLVRFDGDACTLTCTDLELWCQASIPAEGGSCAFVLTGSRRLLTACKFLSGELEFSYRKDQPPEHAPTKTDLDGDLWISCGGKEICQRVTAAEEFPDLPDVEAEHTYTVQTASLRKRFERIKYALSDDSVRQCNRCVKFFDNRIGAVDGYRLAMNRDEALCVDAPFHIPPGAMRLLPVFEGTDCQLLVGKRRAAFDSGDIRIITKLPEGESLDFDAAIPRHYPEGYTVNISDFVGNLQYLEKFISNPSREPIRFNGGVLLLHTKSGDYRSRLDMEDAPRQEIGFRASYMLDGLQQFQAKKLDTVSMQMSTPVSPIILTDQVDTALVLPFYLNRAA